MLVVTIFSRTYARRMPMASSISSVQDLIHLDMDAIKAYEQAIKSCEHENVASQLRSFQADHQRHVQELSDEMRKLGEQPKVTTDIKGFFIEKFTAITSMGTRSALIARLPGSGLHSPAGLKP